MGFGATDVAAQPCRDRKLTETVAAEYPKLGFEHRCHDEHQDKSGERDNEVDGKTANGDRKPDDETEPNKRRASP